MDYASILKIFKLIAAEFKDINEDTVKLWIELTAPFVSKKRFRTMYNQALALLTAHRMKIANAGVDPADDPIGDISGIGVGNLMRVSSYSEGEVSLGFNSNIAQYTETDAELALTPYGIQYLTIRRMRVMPITTAGENYGGS